MLSDSLQPLRCEITDKISLDSSIVDNILNDIAGKKKRSLMYPEVMMEDYNIDKIKILELLAVLEYQSIIKRVYKIYCAKCNDFIPYVFESINDAENHISCDECNADIASEKEIYRSLRVLFMVV